MAENFDVVVIGGGPGGYAAAIRGAQRQASVGLVEKDAMGGTCLNRGCIPSKALLGSAHFLTLAKHAGLMGLDVGQVTPNWTKMQARKDAIVAGFRKGVTGLVQSNKIKIFEGTGYSFVCSFGLSGLCNLKDKVVPNSHYRGFDSPSCLNLVLINLNCSVC